MAGAAAWLQQGLAAVTAAEADPAAGPVLDAAAAAWAAAAATGAVKLAGGHGGGAAGEEGACEWRRGGGGSGSRTCAAMLVMRGNPLARCLGAAGQCGRIEALEARGNAVGRSPEAPPCRGSGNRPDLDFQQLAQRAETQRWVRARAETSTAAAAAARAAAPQPFQLPLPLERRSELHPSAFLTMNHIQ